MKTLILIGSARKDGHSALVSRCVLEHLEAEVLHLSDFSISDYSYDNQYPIDDQFISLIDQLLSCDRLLLVSPVYWYTMSGIMKRFMDRLTDLITVRKDLGYQLKEMSLGAIACGSEKDATLGFDKPFELSADYLGMGYLGFLHTYVIDDSVSPDVLDNIKSFCDKLNG